jgi:hypothetical protein
MNIDNAERVKTLLNLISIYKDEIEELQDVFDDTEDFVYIQHRQSSNSKLIELRVTDKMDIKNLINARINTLTDTIKNKLKELESL